MKRGLFITFEGIDGCGKSTQAKMLADYIFNLSKYNHVLRTREPYKNTDIRKILQEESDAYSNAIKLAEMFVADRKLHLQNMIIPGLNNGIHVISDRYDCSTLAYQQTQGVSFDKLAEMHRGFIIPDITFIVDVPVEIAIERMKKDNIRKEEQKFEKDKTFMEKLRQNYLNIPGIIKDRKFKIIDCTNTSEEVFESQVKPEFDKIYA